MSDKRDIEVYTSGSKAGGTDGQVQYNDGGDLGGSEIEYDDSTKKTTFPDEVRIQAGKKLIFDA